MTAIDTLYSVADFLEKHNIPDGRFEAEQILISVLDITLSELRLQNPGLSDKQRQEVERICQKRVECYPLQYLIGEWEFFGLPFSVGEGVLIPRADTEILVERALNFIDGRENLSIIDLCSGSGCIAVALDKNTTNCSVKALEKEPEALEYLKRNIKLNHSKATPIEGDVMEPMGGGYDLIVSNPPYITAEAMKSLQTEVTYEPDTALYGGEDGLLFYREIVKGWTPLINPEGMLAVEIGFDQREAVSRLFSEAGLKDIKCIKDYGGQDRVITGIKTK